MTIRTCLTLSVALAFLAACGGGEPDTAAGEGGVLDIPSGTYAVDRSHTYVTFSYFHQGLSYPLLRVTGIDGELVLDSRNLENSSVSIAVDAGSIRSNLDYFDKELASRKFFHAEKYPHITFASSSYVPLNESTGELRGFITIRGITKPIVFAVTINGAMQHPMLDKPVIGVSASGSLRRSDFGLDRFVPTVADEVTIDIEAEFLQGSNEGSAAAARIAADAVANADPASLRVAGLTGGGQ